MLCVFVVLPRPHSTGRTISDGRPKRLSDNKPLGDAMRSRSDHARTVLLKKSKQASGADSGRGQARRLLASLLKMSIIHSFF